MSMVREFGESSLMRFQLDRYLGNGNGKLETSEIDAWIKLMEEPDDEDGDEDHTYGGLLHLGESSGNG